MFDHFFKNSVLLFGHKQQRRRESYDLQHTDLLSPSQTSSYEESLPSELDWQEDMSYIGWGWASDTCFESHDFDSSHDPRQTRDEENQNPESR